MEDEEEDDDEEDFDDDDEDQVLELWRTGDVNAAAAVAAIICRFLLFPSSCLKLNIVILL